MSMDIAVSKYVLKFNYKLIGDEILFVFDMVIILNFIKQLFSNLRKCKIITISYTDNISSPINLYLNLSTYLKTALSIDIQ